MKFKLAAPWDVESAHGFKTFGLTKSLIEKNPEATEYLAWYVAIDENDELLAAISLWRGHFKSCCDHIFSFEVVESKRNNGLGGQLLDYAENSSKAIGSLGFTVMAYNDDAQRFYERHGFDLIDLDGVAVLVKNFKPFSFS
jgi:ribosomal protein S18 acetylase RimI-like enzyme